MQSNEDIVVPRHFDISDPSNFIALDNGKIFGPITTQYETYGSLNCERSNAILVTHPFSGDAHATGRHFHSDRHLGWWNTVIGPNKAFDTNRYFIICANVLGGCQGTTGPGSIDPKTGKEYALDFPIITIRDMVKLQEKLITHLGIEQLLSVAGGSMGGMQALEWAVTFPDRLRSSIVIASTARLSAQGIAFNAVGRNAIISDPCWNSGRYYGSEGPRRGLAIARMIGHITYLSDESMRAKFGRKLQQRSNFQFDFEDQFKVESYLEHKGGRFVDRFDANSYIYLSKAIDYFDLGEKYGGMKQAFKRSRCHFLILSYSSDWLYPPQQIKELARAIASSHRPVSYIEIDSAAGHDAFLFGKKQQNDAISSFLASIYDQLR